MKATVTFEIESGADLVALAQFVDSYGLNGPVVEAKAEAPAKPTKPGRKGADKPVEKPEEKKVEEKPVEQAVDLGLEPEEPVVEEVTKATVATALRAFIKDKGEKDGPQQALAVLKKFGASKFDELKAEDYSKFLSALSKAAE